METILIVEDESLTRWTASRVLRRAGFLVLEAATASEALARVAENKSPVALFVIDALLFGVLGSDVARALHLKNPLTPVLYLYDDVTNVLNLSPLEKSGAHYLPPSLVATQLVSHVRRILSQMVYGALQPTTFP